MCVGGEVDDISQPSVTEPRLALEAVAVQAHRPASAAGGRHKGNTNPCTSMADRPGHAFETGLIPVSGPAL